MTDKTPDIIEGIESEFVGHGLVFGKFMPPTNGHLYFINFARQSCRKLTIMVCSLPSEPIPGEQRYKWIKELFPDANVVHHYIDIQQEPNGPNDAAFFETWRDSIKKHCPGEKFDALFASEAYGYDMAKVMGIKHIPVDINREIVPISGTEMRKNPLRHWEHLNPVIRPYFLKRIAIVGPESCGKSTLAKDLAAHFDTVHVAEYARGMLESFAKNIPGYDQSNPSLKDISTIARGQIASEDAIARQANRVMFCDTELMTTKYWSDFYHKTCPDWIAKAAQERKYDLYMLVDPRGVESSYTPDAQRPMETLPERIAMFEWWKAALTKQNKPFVVIDGNDWKKRFQKAVDAVRQHIPVQQSPSPQKRQFRNIADPKKPS